VSWNPGGKGGTEGSSEQRRINVESKSARNRSLSFGPKAQQDHSGDIAEGKVVLNQEGRQISGKESYRKQSNNHLMGKRRKRAV